MHRQVYHSSEIQAWEQRWFAQQNSAYGLMQQVAWTISLKIRTLLNQLNQPIIKIAVCCGQGNNAGDGYLIASYLSKFQLDNQSKLQVDIFSMADVSRTESSLLNQAFKQAKSSNLSMSDRIEDCKNYDVYIDALFGIGINRNLDDRWIDFIEHLNRQHGLKISVDIPSGLAANTGQPLPVAFKADQTYTVLGLKAGLFTGKAKEYCGQIEIIESIPVDDHLPVLARLSAEKISLPARQAFGHKGTYGHVLVIGGHAEMGGAVIMAAEAAFYAGAGKVTVVCDAKHHLAILSRAPNIMVKDINHLADDQIENLLSQIESICFGMGLGRDAWSAQIFQKWFNQIQASGKECVLDADALWFLSEQSIKLNDKTYATPHPGEAAKLLNCSISQVESDRIQAIQDLQKKYSGEWVLKGAGSLTLQNDQNLWICTAGNAGMGTGGMGDILAGMIASLKAQFSNEIQLHEIVTLHAIAGDNLATNGTRGLQAQHMNQAIYKVVNL